MTLAINKKRGNFKTLPAIAIIACAFLTSDLSAQQTQSPAQEQSATTPVPLQQVAILAPSNSRISFVGIHVGDDPKPRLGGFTQFQGYCIVGSSNDSIEAIVFDIEIDSVWTQFKKLTSQLKNADFFDVEKFPAAKFVSTGVEAEADGQCTITGNLTLHGQTKSIDFPAQFRIENGGFVLTAKFKLDRSQFGMDQLLGGVEKLVEVEILVGQQTSPLKEQPSPGGDNKKK